jgi:tetratricopeptide (TPR) repeat protein
LGDLDRARPYYAHLLKVNPNHREGLNNFLALVSAEAPQEALAELERLEQRNPDFSPIPAQQAALLSKNGYADQAREKMLRAIDLAPDNLTYKYNLAVMLDKQGNYTDASALYRLLIDASLKGQKIPAPLETIQKRLNFITAAETNKNSVGG